MQEMKIHETLVGFGGGGGVGWMVTQETLSISPVACFKSIYKLW